MGNLEIPIVDLKTPESGSNQPFTEEVLKDEIAGIQIEYVVIDEENATTDFFEQEYRTVYLFMQGKGSITALNKSYEIVPETIFLPGVTESTRITTTGNNRLHYLKISSKLTAQDKLEIIEFPTENTQQVYYAKFSDCKSYIEPIKSPNTVSRTILPNKYIPRVAMGTVQAKGPDEVGAHEHPMLEQLFLGLSGNNCVVHANDAQVNFPQHSLLHIPLGSRHSVAVEKDEVMYYVWMDFFLDSKGEEWLKTHIED